ncbi:glycosyltransferase family 2 protein [Butyrivibrio sp. MB2005]|uniref:glycosyltransferase family 2 protein n=1 Tax=Butyrivibrio sp. MB2005 TaxID=1280678 RepID=UPI0004158FF5|nr:glycosyltransferase family 2 protein [Butyrivibrio sp. MB2005]
MQSKVTIVIPNYNGKKYMDDCLRSLGKQTMKAPVIIVDNGSEDGSVDVVKEMASKKPGRYPELKFLELHENTGFANAVNVGIKAADSEYVILLNNDTVCEERMTEKLVRAIESQKKVFSVGAKMLSMKNPDVIDDAGDLYCALGWAFSPARDKNSKSYSKRCAVTTACAGAAIYRKYVFEQIGYFDEVHFCYLEDVDVGYRARIYGYKNLMEPSAIVYHAGSGTSGSRYNKFKEELTASNNLYFIYKNMPVLQLIFNLPLFIIGVIIKQVYFARKGLGMSYAKGLLMGIKKIIKHSDRKVPFSSGNLGNYFVLEAELLVNCIRRLAG